MNTERVARMKELAVKIQNWDIVTGCIPQGWLDEYGNLWEDELKEINHQNTLKSKEMRNRRRRGKYLEKKIARDVGGRADGRAGKKDIASGMFHIEAKSHIKTPKYLQNIMSEATRLAGKGKIPVAVIYDRALGDKYVILDYKNWLDLHGNG